MSYLPDLVEPVPIDDPVSLFQDEIAEFKQTIAPSDVKPLLPVESSAATLFPEPEQPLAKEVSDISCQSAYEGDSSRTFTDGLSILVECAVAQIEQQCSAAKGDTSGQRHGISRYAPYGTRFGAPMSDGSFKTSHVAGDLANRARQRGGRGARVDLVLVPHDGEMRQLESAWCFCEQQMKIGCPRPGPSEVLGHLRDEGIDYDYRKPEGQRLLQRNASNFYKRMMEYGKRANFQLESRPSLMDIDLSMFAQDLSQSDTLKSDSLQERFLEDDDFEMEDDDMDEESFLPPKKRKLESGVSRPIKLGLSNKGLSRHSPYGTRFSAEMEDGSVKESFLAGDLTDRARVKGSRHRAELRLVLHAGEITQLETAWEYIQSSTIVPGAAAVLEHLRIKNLDDNHRKPGTVLLQKNAGNFFKRVQEFGKRRAADPNYLKAL
ncbi:hypothetical protein EDD86DRAFT_114804 [Gorgonomyces haynaldii]|nr:hypothetical protein EDD86DRAFT_114804 [Gorgonomyces haynaldii]